MKRNATIRKRKGTKLYPMKRADEWLIVGDDWVVPTKKAHEEMCCDCGLVHIIDFRINEYGQIEYRVMRDDRTTAKIRRTYGIEIKRKEDWPWSK